MEQYDVKRVTKGAESFMVSFDFTKTPITQVADYIIISAAKKNTSDIHFDPREDGLMVRFRIDGDCQDYTFIPKAYERNLTTRIKLLANMNITETRLPQDGAIKGQFGDTYLDMRVACLPTNQGEKIVVRILDYTRSLQGVDSLGFHPKNLEKIHHMMGVPNGIILVTGATGSGKSTTTYSMLSALNKPEINVITVEDPVEMNIEGINQVQVNAEIGMTFAAALRSILREDPNIILIGEIRDSETAQIAVRASITGHLVMSTLHTNNALATVERLLDMDVERYLLSTALTGIISQRLAKQLCPECRYQREATKYEKSVYKKFLHQDVTMLWDANHKGCEHCRNGYKGRIAVHEVLLLDDKIRNALNDENMTKEDFAKMIYGGNTISMLQDALIKVLDGQTSFEEVYKTIEIENEDEEMYTDEQSEMIIDQINTSKESKPDEKSAEKEILQEEVELPNYEVATEAFEESTTIINSDEEPQTQATNEIELPNYAVATEAFEESTPIINSDEESQTQTANEIELPNYEVATEAFEESTPIINSDEESQTQTANEIELPNYEIETENYEKQNNLGYKIAMPEESMQSFEEMFTTETLTEETNQYNNTEIQKAAEESIINNTNNNNVTLESKANKTQKEEKTLTEIEPVVETEYNNNVYTLNKDALEEDIFDDDTENEIPIEPTVEIKTDIDKLIVPHFKLEKLDLSDKDIFISEKLSEDTEPEESENSISTMQAISAVTDVKETTPTEEHTDTGSHILSDPGIRIADDGSINQSAEINAEPILPNYEDDE